MSGQVTLVPEGRQDPGRRREDGRRPAEPLRVELPGDDDEQEGEDRRTEPPDQGRNSVVNREP